MKLNAKRVKAAKSPGMYGDGSGLYLNVAAGGTKSWILRVTIKGHSRRREIGLGSADTLTLAEARTKAQKLRIEAKAGRDPIALRDNREATFEEAALALQEKLSPKFRDEKHKAAWLSTLKNHAFPKIGLRKVATIQRHDVLAVLDPIWIEMHPTAKRLKQRLEAVFDHAIGKSQRSAANPVDRALMRSLGKAGHRPIHHAALSWQDVPSFMADLTEREAIAALCLRFIILTAARSGEARMATWNEIDLKNDTWIIPAQRMKADEEHRVPLSDQAAAILREVQGLDGDLVFPSPQSATQGEGRPLSGAGASMDHATS